MDFLQDHKTGHSGQAVWSAILRQEVFPHYELLFLLAINSALLRVAKSLYKVILEVPKSTESGLEWPPMLVFVYA